MTALASPRTFTCDTATGSVYDHGAHVTSWVPTGAAPVLWMSASTVLDDATPIRGGIPICFPWFGPGRTPAQVGVHGVARVRPWVHLDAVHTREAVTARWSLDVSEGEPLSFHAEYSVTFGRELTLALTITNTGSAAGEFEEALHTYIAVGDIHQVRIEGLDGASFFDKVAGAEAVQRGDVVFTGETDRVYRATGETVLVDPVLQRRIVVAREGAADAVVWNPWIAKAAAMPDFGDDEWTGMVCIEGANALDDAITLQPGASHTMTYSLRVESL